MQTIILYILILLEYILMMKEVKKMDRDLALELLEILTAIKVAVQTIANGGTPPEENTGT